MTANLAPIVPSAIVAWRVVPKPSGRAGLLTSRGR